jgi:threonine dehydratase
MGNSILLKREDMQPVYSFKCRGAFNRMFRLTEEEKLRGVICVSAGNPISQYVSDDWFAPP